MESFEISRHYRVFNRCVPRLYCFTLQYTNLEASREYYRASHTVEKVGQ